MRLNIPLSTLPMITHRIVKRALLGSGSIVKTNALQDSRLQMGTRTDSDTSAYHLHQCFQQGSIRSFVTWNENSYHTNPKDNSNLSHPLSYHHQLRTIVTAPVLHTEMIDVTFITNDGKKLKTKGKIGDNLLDVVVNNSVDLDGFGACEGTLACSTCHLVFKQADFDKIPSNVTDEELDMLDLAYGLTDTSRLGCQVTLTKELDGLEVKVPAGVIDQRS